LSLSKKAEILWKERPFGLNGRGSVYQREIYKREENIVRAIWGGKYGTHSVSMG